MKAARLALPALALVALSLAACDDNDDGEQGAPSPTAAAAAATATPSAARMALGGLLALDGQPVESQFLGARVVRDGLSTACQASIPAVSGGVYQVEILSGDEVRGCGAPGGEVILWVYAGEQALFANETVPWAAEAISFDATFSAAAARGASKPVTELKGRLFDAAGEPLPGGEEIEAYIGETLCGVTTLRDPAATEGYYTLLVAGPDSVPGCDDGAAITFRIDGSAATGAATNTLGREPGAEVDLRLK